MVVLSEQEKYDMCVELAKHLPEIRGMLHVTQAELGYMCGFSRTRVSLMENGQFVMSWSQLTSIMCVVLVNARTKEYFFANNLLGPRFLQFLQRKYVNIPPDVNIIVSRELTESFKDGHPYDYEPEGRR